MKVSEILEFGLTVALVLIVFMAIVALGTFLYKLIIEKL